MIQATLPLLLCQLAGETLSRFLHLPLPGPVLGLILLLLGFKLFPQLIDLVRRVAQGFLGHMPLMFVPAGVGVVGHLDELSRTGLPLLAALVLSTIAAIAVGSVTFATVARLTGSKDEDK